MRTIHKYTLALVDGFQQIEVPAGAEFLTVQMQRGKVCVWAIVDTDRLNEIEYFCIVGTGHPLADKPKFVHYLGTVQQDTLVWHVFRAVK
jgi:hypothetical protein